jgi:serine/threonine protein kinase
MHLFGIVWDDASLGSSHDICPILVQLFADQGNVSQYLKNLDAQGRLLWSTKIDLCKQIQSGLQALHSCNIIHGDIKPENVLVYGNASGGPATLKLSDFGFSIIQDSGVRALQTSGTNEVEFLGGTSYWAAPEVSALHTRTISLSTARLSDVYSFGLVASLIALGGDPFLYVVAAKSDKPPEDKLFNDAAKSFNLETKCKPDHDDIFLPVLTALIIEQEDGESDPSSCLSFWIPHLLARSPEARIQDISFIFRPVVDLPSNTAAPNRETRQARLEMRNLRVELMR